MNEDKPTLLPSNSPQHNPKYSLLIFQQLCLASWVLLCLLPHDEPIKTIPPSLTPMPL